MQLSDAAVGVSVTVQEVGGERVFRRRMMELGLLPGTSVEIVRVAPLGDPLELRVRGCHLSIRKAEARCVTVLLASSHASSIRAKDERVRPLEVVRETP